MSSAIVSSFSFFRADASRMSWEKLKITLVHNSELSTTCSNWHLRVVQTLCNAKMIKHEYKRYKIYFHWIMHFKRILLIQNFRIFANIFRKWSNNGYLQTLLPRFAKIQDSWNFRNGPNNLFMQLFIRLLYSVSKFEPGPKVVLMLSSEDAYTGGELLVSHSHASRLC